MWCGKKWRRRGGRREDESMSGTHKVKSFDKSLRTTDLHSFVSSYDRAISIGQFVIQTLDLVSGICIRVLSSMK